MSPIDIATGFLVGLVAFWLLGGLVARLGGFLFVFAGVANLALDPRVGAALLIVIGAATWLAGHWHYALCHNGYKSALARRAIRGLKLS
jgi:hypothetical protein